MIADTPSEDAGALELGDARSLSLFFSERRGTNAVRCQTLVLYPQAVRRLKEAEAMPVEPRGVWT